MKGIVGPLLSLVLVSTAARTAVSAEIPVRGRIVDESGAPVVGAAVGYYWRANGSGRDKDGKVLDLSRSENVKEFWAHLGEMVPAGDAPCVSGPDGRFELKTPDAYHAVMAVDRSNRRGGLVTLPKGRESDPVEIRVGPLVRVFGSIEGPSGTSRPTWTHVYTLLPEDPTRPLDVIRLVGCGSFEARFEMWLPPGRYTLQAYDDTVGTDSPHAVPDKVIDLDAGTPEVDLGALILEKTPPGVRARVEQSRVKGTLGDYKTMYGKRPPKWRVLDARGVSRDLTLDDLKGKWVLLEFWGLSCRPCLKTGLPGLMKFYEDHAARRDRFEILAVCVDPDDELKSMAEVDRALKPIVENEWGGKTLPFPVLLVPGYETWELFGLDGLGQKLLIDPEGRVVEGDEKFLAEKLR